MSEIKESIQKRLAEITARFADLSAEWDALNAEKKQLKEFLGAYDESEPRNPQFPSEPVEEEQPEARKVTKKNSATEQLLLSLVEGPKSFSDLSQHLGVKFGVVHRNVQRKLVKGKGTRRSRIYSLTRAGKDAAAAIEK